MLSLIGWSAILGLTYLVSRYTALSHAILDVEIEDEVGTCRHTPAPYVEETYRRLRIARRVYGGLVVIVYALCLTSGVTMRRVLQTDLGNAIAWGLVTFGILAGCAGLLWLVGVATGGT